jgi:hypothetical protein
MRLFFGLLRQFVQVMRQLAAFMRLKYDIMRLFHNSVTNKTINYHFLLKTKNQKPLTTYKTKKQGPQYPAFSQPYSFSASRSISPEIFS